jgi:hypothetical protein
MIIFEAIGEFFGQIFIESVFYSIPVKIYEWVTGKDSGLNGYRTEQKKFINFSVAKKFLLTQGTDIEHLKCKVKDGLETMNEELMVMNFQFKTIDQRTIIQPPTSISFYSFHFLVQWLTENKINTIGVVETAQTSYTTYNDPNSENLIGQTSKGKRFFISLMEDYSKRQFLRINRDIKTIDDYDVLALKSGLAHSR